MNAPEFTLFDTAIGRCGMVWGERGVRGFLLPVTPAPQSYA